MFVMFFLFRFVLRSWVKSFFFKNKTGTANGRKVLVLSGNEDTIFYLHTVLYSNYSAEASRGAKSTAYASLGALLFVGLPFGSRVTSPGWPATMEFIPMAACTADS